MSKITSKRTGRTVAGFLFYCGLILVRVGLGAGWLEGIYVGLPGLVLVLVAFMLFVGVEVRLHERSPCADIEND